MNNFNGQRFNSPPMMGFSPRNQYQSTPGEKFQHNNRMRGPYPRSPGYNNHQNVRSPRNLSPYHRDQPRSFNSSGMNSPDHWRARSNLSHSPNSSGSYFGDVSHLSAYSSPRSGGSPRFPQQNRNSPNTSNSSPYHYHNRNSGYASSGSPYNHQNRNRRFQGNRSFQNSDSNPGHTDDIRDYVDSSMTEDPWKDLVAAAEKESQQTS